MTNYNKNIIPSLLSIILVIFIALMASKAYQFSLEYDTQMSNQAEKNKIEYKIDNYLDSLNKTISNYISDYISDEKEPLQNQKLSTANTPKTQMKYYTTLYFIALGTLLLTYFLSNKKIFLISIITASLISWFVGIFAPIMTMEIFKDLPLFGYTVFKYESKGIWTTIEKLWLLQNYFLSIMIALFSIFIPIVKTISLYFSTLTRVDIKYIDFIGKWSMADVFIVSLLFTNLSLSADEFTDAKIQIALYFFCSYVILSILASYLIKKSD